MELLIENENEGVGFWIIFVHASTEPRERQKQLEILKEMRQRLGARWVIRGDFNDIKNNEEKRGGRRRSESSFSDFRDFIAKIEMGDMKFKGETFTWANNRG